MNSYVYICAGSAEQALLYARQNGINKSLIVYVHDPYCLYGIDGKGKKLILTGLYFQRANLNEILETANSGSWEIVEQD